MITHRALTAYLGYDNIENNLEIPIFGNRLLLRAEERNTIRNQVPIFLKRQISDIQGFTKTLLRLMVQH